MSDIAPTQLEYSKLLIPVASDDDEDSSYCFSSDDLDYEMSSSSPLQYLIVLPPPSILDLFFPFIFVCAALRSSPVGLYSRDVCVHGDMIMLWCYDDMVC
jgi:hypothetical protein